MSCGPPVLCPRLNYINSSYIVFKIYKSNGDMTNATFWDVTPSGCCKNQHFGGAYRLHQGDKIQ
jgi:hypothetical protein